MESTKEGMKTCYKCKKEKPADQGYQKLGGMFFCCKECCDKEHGQQDDAKPNVCEFC